MPSFANWIPCSWRTSLPLARLSTPGTAWTGRAGAGPASVSSASDAPSSMPAEGVLTVMTVVGTRPEVIKLAPVVKALKERPEHFRSILCSTGQHRQMLDQTLGSFGLVADLDLQVMVADQTLADLTANVMKA